MSLHILYRHILQIGTVMYMKLLNGGNGDMPLILSWILTSNVFIQPHVRIQIICSHSLCQQTWIRFGELSMQ